MKNPYELHIKMDFLTMLEKDSAVTIRVKNLKLLVTKIFWTQNSLSLTIMKTVFNCRFYYVTYSVK